MVKTLENVIKQLRGQQGAAKAKDVAKGDLFSLDDLANASTEAVDEMQQAKTYGELREVTQKGIKATQAAHDSLFNVGIGTLRSWLADPFLESAEEELFTKMQKSENPEELLMNMETRFFRDPKFVADAIELCAKKHHSLATKSAKKEFAELEAVLKKSKDKKEKISKKDWISKNVEIKEEEFAARVIEKCNKEFGVLAEKQKKEEAKREAKVQAEMDARNARLGRKTNGKGGFGE